MGKHAFLVMAYDRWNQLCTLLSTLDHEDNDIYLHINKKSNDVPFEHFSNCLKKSNLVIVDRIAVSWGNYSVFEAELNCIKAAMNSITKYEYLHLLSGQDLPIKNMKYIHNFFYEHKGANFLNSYPVNELPQEWYERVSLHNVLVGNFRNYNFVIKLLSKITNKIVLFIEKHIGVDRVKKYVDKGIVISGGSTWFSITSEFAEYVIKNEKIIADIFKKQSLFADEMVLQTIIHSSEYEKTLFKPEGYVKDGAGSLRFIDWNRGQPYTWRKEDFNMLTSNNYLFARKFDEKIDNDIIQMIVDNITKEESVGQNNHGKKH